MPLPVVPESFAVVLAACAPCFPPSTSRVFCHLVAGWLPCAGRHTVANVALAAGPGGVGWRHISAFHRFFGRATWAPDTVGKVVFTRALRLLAAGVPISLLVDDRLARKEGTAIALGSMQHDPLRSTRRRPFSRFGQVWVVVALWLPLPFGGPGGPRGPPGGSPPPAGPAVRRQPAGQPQGFALPPHVRDAGRAGAGRRSRRCRAAPDQARVGTRGACPGRGVGGGAGARAHGVRRGGQRLGQPHHD